MPAELFDNDDEYRHWLSTNANGFVVNMWRNLSPRYMVLHRASCHTISEPTHENEPGGFTERQYSKVAARDVESLRERVPVNGRPDRTFSNECSHCRPIG